MGSFNRKLAAYSGAAVAAGGALAGTSRAAIVTTTGAGSGGTTINDAGGGIITYYESDTVTNPSGDASQHVYLKTNGNTTGAGKDSPAFVVSAAGNSGALSNLAPGTTVGPSNLYSTTSYYTSNSSQNTDLGYFDTVTGANYTPAGNTPDQFVENTPGYFGVSFTPAGSSTVDYGYVTLALTNPVAGQTALTLVDTLTYDDSGAPVTVPVGVSIPEPASVALLAIGAVGLLRKRTA